MAKILNQLFNRRIVLYTIAILVQAFFLMLVLWRFGNFFIYFYIINIILSLIVVLFILNNKSNPAYKIAWIVPILLLPIFGGLIYLMFGNYKTSKKVKRDMQNINEKMEYFLKQQDDVMESLKSQSLTASNQSRYIQKYAFCPIYKKTTSEYLTPGEVKFKYLIKELKKAKRYIFLEYFIIEEGIMWNTILDILVEKAKQGIDVRVIYDDMGCLSRLPFGYDKQLEAKGIKCSVFNPFIPILSLRHNNRDHRKIVVIDGHTAFTGGINLADEYINAIDRFGHWKDASIMIEGEAAWNFSVFFLSLWEYLRGEKIDYELFKPLLEDKEEIISDGFIQPFADSPIDDETVSEIIYLNLISQAKRYVYINTPYLILDNKLTTALITSAKRGVDVRIITPHIPDKWYVHSVSRSSYAELIESGVSIYEYTPGFMHSKVFVVDDQIAVVGTINLDYRSLFLHFECGVWMYGANCIKDIKKDFLQSQELSQRITSECCNSIKWYKKLISFILRIFAPLM